jgi:hypothetical protein
MSNMPTTRAMLVQADAPEKRVSELTYVRSRFQVLDEIRRDELVPSVAELAHRLRRRNTALPANTRGQPFRLMFSLDGQLTGIPASTRDRLSAAIQQQTGGRQHPRGGRGIEFWVIGRRGYGRLLLGLRLPGTAAVGATAAGALAADLATLLVLAGDPRRDDAFLDPFAGSGALVSARASWPSRELIAADINRPALWGVPRVRVLVEDARTLPSVADHSVTVVVTDPPWYEFEQGVDPFEDFVRSVLANLTRVLVPRDGRLVILMSRRRAPVVAGLWKEAGLTLRTEVPILVNGHPATVLIGGTN